MNTKIGIILMSVLLLLIGMLIGNHGNITIVKYYQQRPLRIVTSMKDITTEFTIHIADDQVFGYRTDHVVIGNSVTQSERDLYYPWD